MKLIAFLGEKYLHYENNYFATPTSAAFLQKTLGKENVIIISPSMNTNKNPESFSSKVNELNFIPSPYYLSTKDFLLKSIFKRNFYKNFITFSDDIIKNNPDAIFWIRTPSIGSIFFGLRVIKYKRKLINHMCADIKDTWRDKKYSIVEKCFGFITSRVLRFLLSKICSNKNTTNLSTGSALQAFGLKYSPKTYQFVDLMSESILSDTIKINESKLSKDQFTLTFVGRLVEDKGIFDLLHIINNIPFNIKLNIVGGGESYNDVLNFVKKNSLEERVIVYGQLAFTDLNRVYNNTDLTIVPSKNYYEGFPRVIMESWFHGIPVIVSNVGGISAFVKNNINGLIFNPGDINQLEELILQVINNEEKYNHLKKGAISMAEVSTFKYWSNTLYNIIHSKKNET